jgi:hypothetical protein
VEADLLGARRQAVVAVRLVREAAAARLVVPPVRLQLPRVDAVAQARVQQRLQLALEHVVGDGRAHLDAAHQVARHPVRAADEEARLAAVLEAEDAVVLQKTPDDAHHAHALRQARHARPHAADAAHNQIDAHARGSRLVQLLHQHAVVQAVHLGGDAGGTAGVGMRNLVVDQLAELAAHGVGRHQQLAVGRLAVVAGQVLEQV